MRRHPIFEIVEILALVRSVEVHERTLDLIDPELTKDAGVSGALEMLAENIETVACGRRETWSALPLRASRTSRDYRSTALRGLRGKQSCERTHVGVNNVLLVFEQTRIAGAVVVVVPTGSHA